MDSDSILAEIGETQTESGETSWKDSELLERRSVIGMFGIAAVIGLFVLVVPWINDKVEQTGGLDSSGRFIIDDYTAIELADGWTIENQSEFLTIVTDGSYSLALVLSAPNDATPSDALREVYDVYEQDPAIAVTPIETFSTDAGGEAAGYRALLPTDPSGNGLVVFNVSQAGRMFSSTGSGPSDLDDPFYEDLEVMFRSVVITAEPREAS